LDVLSKLLDSIKTLVDCTISEEKDLLFLFKAAFLLLTDEGEILVPPRILTLRLARFLLRGDGCLGRTEFGGDLGAEAFALATLLTGDSFFLRLRVIIF
jgi:hypothetical protein